MSFSIILRFRWIHIESFDSNHYSTRTEWLAWKGGFGLLLRHCDLVLTALPVFSTEVMGQTYCQSLQSRFSFLICGAYGTIERSSYVSHLHQKKSLHWAFLISFQHKCSIEKAELLTTISSSLELVLLEWSCTMQWLEWLNKWSLQWRRCFSAVHVLSSLWNLHCTLTQAWDRPAGSSQGLSCMTFSITEKRGDLSVHTCPTFLQQTTEFWGI